MTSNLLLSHRAAECFQQAEEPLPFTEAEERLLIQGFDASCLRHWENQEVFYHRANAVFESTDSPGELPEHFALTALQSCLESLENRDYLECRKKPILQHVTYSPTQAGEQEARALRESGITRKTLNAQKIQSSSNPHGLPLEVAILVSLSTMLFFPATATELASWLRLPSANISAAVSRLRNKGLMTRHQPTAFEVPELRYRLTAQGQSLRKQMLGFYSR